MWQEYSTPVLTRWRTNFLFIGLLSTGNVKLEKLQKMQKIWEWPFFRDFQAFPLQCLCGNRVPETTDYLNKKKMANNDIPKKITVSLKKNSWRPGIKKMASKYNPPRFYSYRIQIDLVFWNNNRAMFKITDHLWLYTHYCYSYWEKETSIFKGIYDTRRLQDLSQLKIFTLWILHYCWFFTVPQVKYN